MEGGHPDRCEYAHPSVPHRAPTPSVQATNIVDGGACLRPPGVVQATDQDVRGSPVEGETTPPCCKADTA